MIFLFAKLILQLILPTAVYVPGTAPPPSLHPHSAHRPTPASKRDPDLEAKPKDGKHSWPETKPRPSHLKPRPRCRPASPLGSARRLKPRLSRLDAARAVTSAHPTLDLLPSLCARTLVLQRRPPGSDSGVFLLCSFCHSGIVPHAAARTVGAGDSPVHPLLSSLHRPALRSSKTFWDSALSTLF